MNALHSDLGREAHRCGACPQIEWTFVDVRGASDFTRCEWNLVLRATGETPDGWSREADLPTITLTASVAELHTLVTQMVHAGLFATMRGWAYQTHKTGLMPAAIAADTVYVTACRIS